MMKLEDASEKVCAIGMLGFSAGGVFGLLAEYSSHLVGLSAGISIIFSIPLGAIKVHKAWKRRHHDD